jgi:cytoplasmic iron level regulating protein YaaA (DUF328/UPF0246 family)
MICILSPAKTLNTEPSQLKEFTLPVFKEESLELVSILKKKKVSQLKSLMKISDKLSALNVERYQNFREDFNLETSKQAILTFKGDVYLGLQAEDFNKTELKRAQKSIRILSGLYGIIKPLDLMQAYRLEMGTKLKTRKWDNLYKFWDLKITDALNKEFAKAKNPTLINLASKEYFKSVDRKKLNAEIIDIDFREYKGDDLKFISFNAKKARGLMAKYVVKNNIKKAADLKGFDYENYHFSAEHSDTNKWMFVR